MNQQKRSKCYLFYIRRIQAEKEKNTQKMREKQERAQDKQSGLDAARAKRAMEDAERKARERERNDILTRVT